MLTKRPLLLDVDTGVDDAIAIALARKLATHELVAVTTVAGNVPIERATDNTLRVLDWLDYPAPVYRGASSPLFRPLHTAEEFHGSDGLGGWSEPAATREAEPVTAPEAIVQLASQYRGEIDFAFVGPLTNLAIALNLEPRIAGWVNRLVIMGGAFAVPGNVSSHAEFNIFVDPEAAAQVARSSFNTTWIGLDVTHQTVLSKPGWSGFAQSERGTPRLVHQVCRHAFEVRQRTEFHLHDPLAVAVVANSRIVSTTAGDVVVALEHSHRAQTRVATYAAAIGTHAVAVEVDTDAFHRSFARLAE